jgi:hypothetical protein
MSKITHLIYISTMVFFSSLFGLFSIIMTYFALNYYLTGSYSYAAEDPIPVTNWVYISAAFKIL